MDALRSWTCQTALPIGRYPTSSLCQVTSHRLSSDYPPVMKSQTDDLGSGSRRSSHELVGGHSADEETAVDDTEAVNNVPIRGRGHGGGRDGRGASVHDPRSSSWTSIDPVKGSLAQDRSSWDEEEPLLRTRIVDSTWRSDLSWQDLFLRLEEIVGVVDPP